MPKPPNWIAIIRCIAAIALMLKAVLDLRSSLHWP
jgi:hypothetical protein